MTSSPLTPHPSPPDPARAAFTLVEMLVAMVLTLILITSIAQFYAIIGDSVKDGRAMIEVSGRVRAVVERLKSDLDLITVPLVPWTDEGAASGYFVYFEGIGNDYLPDSSTNMADVPTIGSLATNGFTNMAGDGDDFLAFTIRASGTRFTGRYTVPLHTASPVIQSAQLAEVVWWVSFTDLDSDGVWDTDEPRQLHRRQLLIRPDLTNIDNNTDHSTAQAAFQRLREIWQENDISLSVRAELNASNTLVYRIRPNSLADLAKRENRFAHAPVNLTWNPPNPPSDASFPHRQLLVPSVSATSPGLQRTDPSLPPTQSSFVLNGQSQVRADAPGTFDFPGESPGDDIILSDVLAFDVQVYDPYARLWPDNPAALNNSTSALIPSDPSYLAAATAASSINPLPLVGLGAFVDLGYYRYANTFTIDNNMATSSGIRLPYYANLPDFPPALAGSSAPQITAQNTYRTSMGYSFDTWSLNYERDGIFQLASYGVNVSRMDLQTNGIDDDNANGVDDTNERETIPPYSQPLRGLRIRLRVYEPSTRLVRQATVATDFLNE